MLKNKKDLNMNIESIAIVAGFIASLITIVEFIKKLFFDK